MHTPHLLGAATMSGSPVLVTVLAAGMFTVGSLLLAIAARRRPKGGRTTLSR